MQAPSVRVSWHQSSSSSCLVAMPSSVRWTSLRQFNKLFPLLGGSLCVYNAPPSYIRAVVARDFIQSLHIVDANTRYGSRSDAFGGGSHLYSVRSDAPPPRYALKKRASRRGNSTERQQQRRPFSDRRYTHSPTRTTMYCLAHRSCKHDCCERVMSGGVSLSLQSVFA